MRRLAVLLAAGVAATGSVAAAAIAMVPDDATSPSGVHITPLSTATLRADVRATGSGIRIRTHGPKVVLVTSITVDPGGSFGWHTHPGPVIATVAKGTLALYQPNGHGCPRSTVRPGHAFIEGGGDVHLARNEGSAPVELNATFLARAGTKEFLTPVDEPPGCDI
jgi:quercetin dioxygenase-like cupin family protein